MTTEEVLGRFIGFATTALIVGLIVWFGKRAFSKTEREKFVASLPGDIQKIYWDAAKFASEFVELMDKNGAFSNLREEFRSKGEVKLALAVDEAIKYIEGLFIKNGLEVDIDEGQIKAMIQKYVWQNPDLFPSGDEKETEIPNKAGDQITVNPTV